jgi:hypothetical protein
MLSGHGRLRGFGEEIMRTSLDSVEGSGTSKTRYVDGTFGNDRRRIQDQCVDRLWVVVEGREADQENPFFSDCSTPVYDGVRAFSISFRWKGE